MHLRHAISAKGLHATTHSIAGTHSCARQAVTNFGLREYPEALLAQVSAAAQLGANPAADAEARGADQGTQPPPPTPDVPEPGAPRARRRAAQVARLCIRLTFRMGSCTTTALRSQAPHCMMGLRICHYNLRSPAVKGA